MNGQFGAATLRELLEETCACDEAHPQHTPVPELQELVREDSCACDEAHPQHTSEARKRALYLISIQGSVGADGIRPGFKTIPMPCSECGDHFGVECLRCKERFDLTFDAPELAYEGHDPETCTRSQGEVR